MRSTCYWLWNMLFILKSLYWKENNCCPQDNWHQSWVWLVKTWHFRTPSPISRTPSPHHHYDSSGSYIANSSHISPSGSFLQGQGSSNTLNQSSLGASFNRVWFLLSKLRFSHLQFVCTRLSRQRKNKFKLCVPRQNKQCNSKVIYFRVSLSLL